jgi:lipoprotein-anchoring transpeptidase ErfK/SrfK
MRRAFVSALLASALYTPAWSGPLQIGPDAAPAQSDQGGAAVQSQPQQRYATQSNMGGGFIEFLFSGAAREPTVPRAYQPVPDERNSARGYQPATTATVTTGATTQPDYGPQQAALPDYGPQQASAPSPQQTALFNSAAPQNFAPSSQGDTTHPPVDPKFDRQLVAYKTVEKPGTLIIDTPNHFLFLVQENGKAMRYGIGVGRPGFTWEGVKTITAKKEWPDWYPPVEMIQRRPDLPRYMAGGPENPLGARAMYLGSTLYRIHGSNEPWTIGGNVSSGCIRLRNADIIDLYSRVQVGTKVVVM